MIRSTSFGSNGSFCVSLICAAPRTSLAGFHSNPKTPLKTRKLLILKAQKTHRTQETLVSLRSYYDRDGLDPCDLDFLQRPRCWRAPHPFPQSRALIQTGREPPRATASCGYSRRKSSSKRSAIDRGISAAGWTVSRHAESWPIPACPPRIRKPDESFRPASRQRRKAGCGGREVNSRERFHCLALDGEANRAVSACHAVGSAARSTLDMEVNSPYKCCVDSPTGEISNVRNCPRQHQELRIGRLQAPP